jgi:hypothetical protein
MLAAVWSKKAAVEYQDNVLVTSVIVQGYRLSMNVF